MWWRQFLYSPSHQCSCPNPLTYEQTKSAFRPVCLTSSHTLLMAAGEISTPVTPTRLCQFLTKILLPYIAPTHSSTNTVVFQESIIFLFHYLSLREYTHSNRSSHPQRRLHQSTDPHPCRALECRWTVRAISQTNQCQYWTSQRRHM